MVSLLNHQANSDVDTERALAAEMGQDTVVTDLLADNEEDIIATWLTRSFFPWERDGYPWWSVFHHGETFWQHRDQDNIFLSHYSQLKTDLAGEMRRIAEFLDIEINEDIFPKLVEAATFDSMKKNADALAPGADANLWKDNSQFFNKGTSGQWQAKWSQDNLDRLFTLSKSYPQDYIEWLFAGG